MSSSFGFSRAAGGVRRGSVPSIVPAARRLASVPVRSNVAARRQPALRRFRGRDQAVAASAGLFSTHAAPVPSEADFKAFVNKATAPQSKTKIVCTIGPASEAESVLQGMIAQGMDVARINFSHGTHAEHKETFERLRRVGDGTNLAVLCDIQGPKIRVGAMREQLIARVGQTLLVTDDESLYAADGGGGPLEPAGASKGAPAGRLVIKLEGLVDTMKEGDPIFINDGIVKLLARERRGREWVCEVDAGGPISSNKGCNLPNAKLAVDVLTPKDKVDLEFIATVLRPEFVAVSFVGTGDDVRAVREYLHACGGGGPQVRLISKIERKLALENIDDIIAASDGIMVARGDLGVEVDGEDVPVAQKMLARACNRAGIPCIVATQMLESMTHSQRPTRAETNDVFNAVHDGADAVMLSGETSVGVSPEHTVAVMDQIVNKAEKTFPDRDPRMFVQQAGKPGRTEATGLAVFELCRSLSSGFEDGIAAGRIICVSDADDAGFTCRQIAKYRPDWNIIAVTDDKPTGNTLNLLWGVEVVQSPPGGSRNHDDQVHGALRACLERDLIDRSQTVIVVGRSMLGRRVGTSVSTLHVGMEMAAQGE